MSYASFAEELRKWWSFDDRQFHTHSWHSREDFIKDKMRELIDAETKPLHTEIERLRAALRKLYHVGPRPWMRLPNPPSYPDWDAAMSEAERLLDADSAARDIALPVPTDIVGA